MSNLPQIWKFELPTDGLIEMPKYARPISVQTQRGVICLWALIEPNQPVEMRKFVILGTGHEIPKHGVGDFIDTFQLNEGSLVFHVFEALK